MTTEQTEYMSLGWLDNNQAEQDKIKEMLSLLQEKGTLDEIGIGTIRDAFSNLLFPGITTIQTRAKYLVILLYLFREADALEQKAARKNNPLSPDDLIRFINDSQDKLVKVFEDNGLNERGVIGIRARNVVQKPTFIYWGALRTFGMVNPNLSLKQMCGLICDNAKAEQKRKQSVKDNNNDDYDKDDYDACLEGYPRIYTPISWNNDNWREGLKMDLTYDEAAFISRKILNSDLSKNSALAQLLIFYRDNNISCNIEKFDDIPEAALDDKMKAIFQLASEFRKFIYGAHIVYNYLLSGKKDVFLKEAFDEWKDKLDFDHKTLDAILKTTNASNVYQEQFLNALLNFAKSGEWGKFENCIIAREKALKGDRSKIRPSMEKTTYKSPFSSKEDVAKSLMLDFRARRAGIIILDILEGLKKQKGEN